MAKVQLDGVLKLVDVQINPQVFRKISQSVANMPAALRDTSRQLEGAKRGAKGLNDSLKKTTSQLTQAQKAGRLFFRRMAQFAILLPTFATLNRSIQGGVKFLFEFDSALRDIVRIDISNLASRMEEVGDAAIQTALDFGVTATEVLNVTKTFKQAGFTIEESQEKAKTAILATQVSTLNAKQATEVFIAAQQQFAAEGENSIDVLDRLAKVEDIAAVEAADVADAFRTGGNALAFFTKSLDDSIGLIAALRQQTRKSGREIGTFFKTFATRASAAGEAQDAIRALGVEVVNLDGSIRPGLDILNDLGAAFDNLTESQQATAAKSIAGVRQFEGLLATLKSLSLANEFAAESSKAAGTAEEKRLVTDAKLERQLGKLIAQGQAFAEALGDAGIADALVAALQSAQSLLSVFGKIVSITGELGGTLAPLLALGAVTLGKGVFGFGGKGKGKGSPADAATTAASTNFQGAIKPVTSNFKRFGTILNSGSRAATLWTSSIATSLQASKAQGVSIKANTTAIGIHTGIVKQNLAAMKASAVASLKNAAAQSKSTALFLGLSLAASFLPDLFNKLGNAVRGGTTEFERLAREGVASALETTGAGASLAAQFAFLGPQAAALGFAFGTLSDTVPKIFDAFDERTKSLASIKSDDDFSARTEEAGFALSGARGQKGQEFANQLFEQLAKSVKGVNFGNTLNKAIDEAFAASSIDDLGKKLNFNGLELEADNLKQAVFGNIDVLKKFINGQKEFLRFTASSNDRLGLFNELIVGLENGTLNSGQAFNILVKTLGAGVVEISEATNTLKRSLSFEEFKKAREVIDLADSVRTLGVELEIAKMGPDALSDAVVRLRSELMLTEREFQTSTDSFNETISRLFTDLGNNPFLNVEANPQGLDSTNFFQSITQALDTLDTGKIKDFNALILELPDDLQATAKEIVKLTEDRINAELKLVNKQNDLTKEISSRRNAVLEEEQKATQNAMESSLRFTAELKKFGDAVDSDVLQVFQNASLVDVDAVLAGQSELSQGVQQLILSAFGDEITKAQTRLQSVSSKTESELTILATRLQLVTEKLADESNAADKAKLIGEQRSIQLEMETTQQQGAVKLTDAKIKVLEAEQKAIKDASDAEEKRVELLEKLADASREFDKDLRDIQKSFEEFTADKLSDLLDQEVDARQELKGAQSEVLSSTEGLADAYDSLIKAQLEYNNAIAEAQIKSNMLANDIAALTGEVFTFDGQLSALSSAFDSVLGDANITLQTRISLERQLAEETLSFLQQARDEIVQAGLGIFGQTGAENQALGQGIAGLQFVAEQLGGTFENFLALSQGDLASIGQTLLSLPAEFRQQILDALSFLPSTTDIGGFSVEQLTQAIGQVGAGVGADEGLPSIEELNNQQVEQLQKLQELSLQAAQLQISQVISAQEAVATAQEQLEAAQILEERAREGLAEVRDAVLEEKSVLDSANEERRELLASVVAADDKNTLMQIEKEAQLFAEQNATFREIGDNIVRGISSAIGGRLAVIEAAANVTNAAKGFIPNFGGGNLSPKEASGLLDAARREKRAMPTGAGLAVANTSETIIPNGARGYIPNFQDGTSEISAGISAVKQINETVVAAIARSVTASLADIRTGGSDTSDLLEAIIKRLNDSQAILEDINSSNALIQTNTSATDTGGGGTGAAQDVRISLQTNQNNTVSVTGLESLREQIRAAVMDTTRDQVDEQVEALLTQLDSVFVVLQERGQINAFGQSR